MDKDRLSEIIDYLKTNPSVECDPYPSYDKRIIDLLLSIGEEIEYMTKYDLIADKDINEMNLDGLKAFYTFILRSERFCDGSIKAYLEDGTILKLALRQNELINLYDKII